jgi:protein transport protein SEC61 subunit gamma-like protein
MGKAKEFFGKCKRVWFTMRKPTKKEFETVAKISAIGILVIGLFGFIFSVIMKIFS